MTTQRNICNVHQHESRVKPNKIKLALCSCTITIFEWKRTTILINAIDIKRANPSEKSRSIGRKRINLENSQRRKIDKAFFLVKGSISFYLLIKLGFFSDNFRTTWRKDIKWLTGSKITNYSRQLRLHNVLSFQCLSGWTTSFYFLNWKLKIV